MLKTKLAIIGSGPSGYTAGVYAGRAQLAPVIFTGSKSGGQLMWTTDIENFPGFPDGIAGPDLMINMRTQAAKFGADLRDKFVTAVDFSAQPFKLWSTMPAGKSEDFFENASAEEIAKLITDHKKNTPHDVEAEAVIIATGAVSRLLGKPGEKEFLGRGVSTCAVCAAAFYRDRTTFVIGGGDSAMEEAMALTKFASSVTIVHRSDKFRAGQIMQDRVLQHPRVKVLWNTNLVEVKGDQLVSSIVVESDGKQQELPADGVFIAIGHQPMSQLFVGQVDLDSHGYVKTAGQFNSMTSVPGVFAGGDVVDIRYKQAITAAGQGCQAALDAERWLESQHV